MALGIVVEYVRQKLLFSRATVTFSLLPFFVNNYFIFFTVKFLKNQIPVL
jgi:hypothetical protein